MAARVKTSAIYLRSRLAGPGARRSLAAQCARRALRRVHLHMMQLLRHIDQLSDHILILTLGHLRLRLRLLRRLRVLQM